MFRTILNRERIYSNVGSPIVKEYKVDDSTGVDKLVETGEYNLYEKIQAYRESCDLHSILNRFMKTGDQSILNRVQGQYMDVSAMPKEKIEWIKAFNEATDMFYRLPVDIRSKFDNDPKKFYINIGTDSFKEIFNINNKNDSVDVIKKEDIKENE